MRPALTLATFALFALMPASASADGGLLIVAPEKFHPSLRAFVKYKSKLLTTELVALEPILKKTAGVDDPERLKRYLFQQWKKKKIGYVLLVGDVDVLPMRYMVLDRVTPAAFDYAFYPSDLYYADLAKQNGSFDDWNGRKEGFHAGYFGEVRGEKNKKDPINYDDIDYRPEVAVGRWPVSTPEEVARVAAKSMTYENGVLGNTKKPGKTVAGFFAVGGWVDMRSQMDRYSASLNKTWKIEKRYFGGGKGKPAPPDERQLVDLLNSGAGLVCHAGHGSEHTWEGCFSMKSMSKVKNSDKLPVMISAGCSTAHCAPLAPYAAYVDVAGKEHKGTDKGEVFKSPPPPPAPYQKGKYNVTGLGEQLLRHGKDGAVAYIGCNTGSQPCGLTLVEGFMQALGKSKAPRLGDCWNEAIRHYYDKEKLATLKPDDGWYPPSIFFQGMKFMVFGDPSLRLPGADKK